MATWEWNEVVVSSGPSPYASCLLAAGADYNLFDPEYYKAGTENGDAWKM